MLGFFRAADEWIRDGCQNGAAVTVIEGESAGEKALMADERIVWKSAQSGVADRYEAQLAGITESGVYRIGGCSVFCEILGAQKKLVICGGGHVSIPVIQIGNMIGCHVTVLEDRPKFADHARRAGASEVICEPFAQGLEKINGSADTFFLILTRGHRYDQICLEAVSRKEHAYIGMIASRRRAEAVKQLAVEHGCDADVINRVYTPVGLDIGARTPEEIAVAIAAEIICVKNKTRHGSLPREIIDAVLQDKDDARQPKVLATIIRRRGSAPREVGTKMLVLADGSCIGTIGGGCVESDIQKRALLLMRENGKKIELCHVDMSGKDAGEEGMACGGMMDVLLEVLLPIAE